MLAALQDLRGEHGFALEVIDIDMSAELRERYDALVPVLAHDGEQICHYFLNEEAVNTYLRDHANQA